MSLENRVTFSRDGFPFDSREVVSACDAYGAMVNMGFDEGDLSQVAHGYILEYGPVMKMLMRIEWLDRDY